MIRYFAAFGAACIVSWLILIAAVWLAYSTVEWLLGAI